MAARPEPPAPSSRAGTPEPWVLRHLHLTQRTGSQWRAAHGRGAERQGAAGPIGSQSTPPVGAGDVDRSPPPAPIGCPWK